MSPVLARVRHHASRKRPNRGGRRPGPGPGGHLLAVRPAGGMQEAMGGQWEPREEEILSPGGSPALSTFGLCTSRQEAALTKAGARLAQE